MENKTTTKDWLLAFAIIIMIGSALLTSLSLQMLDIEVKQTNKLLQTQIQKETEISEILKLQIQLNAGKK